MPSLNSDTYMDCTVLCVCVCCNQGRVYVGAIGLTPPLLQTYKTPKLLRQSRPTRSNRKKFTMSMIISTSSTLLHTDSQLQENCPKSRRGSAPKTSWVLPFRRLRY